MDIRNSLLSTKPFISLRFPGDDSGIIKLTEEYSESCDVVMLVTQDGKSKMIYAHCQTARFDVATILSHLVDRLKDEAGISLQIHHWGRGVNLVDVGWGNYSIYLGVHLLGTFGVVDTGSRVEVDLYTLVIPDRYNNYQSQIGRLANAELLKNSKYVSSNEQRIIEKSMRLMMDLPTVVHQIYFKKYNIPCKTLTCFREWVVSQDKQSLIKILRSVIAFHGAHQASVVNLGESIDGTVYVTRGAGIDAAKAELDIYVSSNTPAVFIVLNKEPSAITSIFLAGYLSNAFKRYGTEKAFKNRFKFIGFEGKQQLINDAIKAIISEK
jgi:hypothetical protein